MVKKFLYRGHQFELVKVENSTDYLIIPYALKEIGEAHYQGSEHGYQYAVDKAVEFLKEKEFGDWIEQEATSFIEDFRKAMK